MRALLLLLLVGHLLGPAVARADEREVMLFVPPRGGFSLDDERLTSAVRIYTRDVPWGDADKGGRLTLWYEGRAEGRRVRVTLYVLPPGQEGHGPAMVQVRGTVDDSLYRALGLKVRAVLAGDPTIDRVAAAPTTLVPSPVTPPVVPRPPPVVVPPPPPVVVPAPPPVIPPPPPPAALPAPPAAVPVTVPATAAATEKTAPPPERPVRARLEATVHGRFSDGDSRAALGGNFDLAVPIWGPLEACTGVAIDAPSTVSENGKSTESWVIPVHVCARALWTSGKLQLGGGVRLGAMVYRASSRASEEQAASSTVATGFTGLEVLVRYAAARHVALFGQVTADLAWRQVQYTHLFPGEDRSLNPGGAFVAVGAGASFSLP